MFDEQILATGISTLMIQGTTSDAGKSFTVAALCRIFANRSIKVAPFKPQNMALNSAVTADAGEIGRAQALQAVACRTEASVHMNPILLKPSSDTGAQVIVQGRAISAMEAAAYHDYKKVAMDAVLESHAKLKQHYELIVVEGAGSPAEINLREGDIANMGFAEAVDCPVIIVADIDRGGVFAQIVGTVELLSKTEQDRVIGFIINRFRGDVALLKSGLDWLEKRTQKPVLAVMPYLQGCYLDAEDAIEIRQELPLEQAPEESSRSRLEEGSATWHQANNATLRVAIAIYPRVSNHTDFDALRLHPGINVEFVAPGCLPSPCDVIILPGSKNVRADLAWLKECGWPEHIRRHLRYGGRVLGICGGYQMLGLSIDDPQGIEDQVGCSQGLGLVPMYTVLAEQKITQNRCGRVTLGDRSADVVGYEIHCGRSHFTVTAGELEHASLIEFDNGETEGYVSVDGQVLGTYLHGLFDLADSLTLFLSFLGFAQSSGASVPESMNDIREAQLERIAQALDAEMHWSKFDAALKQFKSDREVIVPQA